MKPNQLPTPESRLAARNPDGQRSHVMNHRWESLLFLHWPMTAARIQRTLPAGLTVDTFEGNAYLGIIPFFMRRVRLTGLPPVPGVSAFQELNVRTYVYDEEGVPGVWFYSLSCNQPLAVAGALLFTGLNYVGSEMSANRRALIEYTCRRQGSAEIARYQYGCEGAGQEARTDSLEFFLLERYYLYALRFGSLLRAQVSHTPYRYRNACVTAWSPVPAQLDGFPELVDNPGHSCYVDALDVKIYATQKLARKIGSGP
jgi:uncharacterized protein YqjF (DUF2071 family)